jgi:hypothetical protein
MSLRRFVVVSPMSLKQTFIIPAVSENQLSILTCTYQLLLSDNSILIFCTGKGMGFVPVVSKVKIAKNGNVTFLRVYLFITGEVSLSIRC